MPCNCDEIKEQLELMREQIELMRRHSSENYMLLIEVRDKIGAECANIMSFLYPLAMKEASKEIQVMWKNGGDAEVQSVAEKYKEFTDGLSATNANCIESGPYRFYGIGGEVDDKDGVE